MAGERAVRMAALIRNVRAIGALVKHKHKGSMMAGGSKTVVIAALGANLAIAVAKFGGAIYTGSAAMLSEGVHSLVDTGNQGLLLFGMARAARPADARHPFGYSREIYFWSFIVALLLFSVGGIVAIYEGVSKLQSPHPVESPMVNYAILIVALALETGSFLVALKEFRAVAAGTTWWRAVTDAKDPVLFTVLFEDSAALIGLVIALGGLLGAQLLGFGWMDGAASVLIGAVLVCSAVLLARETHALLIGEGADPAVLADIEARIACASGIDGVRDLLSTHLGPHDIAITVAVDFDDKLSAGEVEASIAALTAQIRSAYPDVKHLSLVPTSFKTALPPRG